MEFQYRPHTDGDADEHQRSMDVQGVVRIEELFRGVLPRLGARVYANEVKKIRRAYYKRFPGE